MNLYGKLVSVLAILLLASCASARLQDDIGVSMEVMESIYAEQKEEMGLVLLDARWARQWGCGRFENAQLISFSFDRFPFSGKPDHAPHDITVGTTRVLSVQPTFESYALLVPPGKYALSNFRIRVAASVSQVGYWVANRSDLIQGEKVIGGSFEVAAGEVIYIGNFALDCQDAPTLWRYHPTGKDAFESQLDDYRAKYPFIDLGEVKFRLFETDQIGYPYELQ